VQICRSGPTAGSPVEIEAQPITFDVAGAVLERPDATSDAKGAFMHVGAIDRARTSKAVLHVL
jgi:hypothetical protein